MAVANAEIAEQLDKVADLLDIEGANPFRVRAYRRAARLIEGLPRSVADMLAEGADLDELPGIGPDLAAKIAEIARGGHLAMLDALAREVPPGITSLLRLPGLGPKRVHLLQERLGIDSIEKLEAAAKSGRLREVPGIGPGTQVKVLRALATGAANTPRTRLAAAEQIALPLLRHIAGTEGVLRAEVAGSFRRRRETVGDLDLVVAAAAGQGAMRAFTGYEAVAEVVERGPTRATVRLRNGLQVDLRVVGEESYGAALCYFTGSKAHNIALRQIAVERGWKLNEYGLFEGGRRLAGGTEAELYKRLGLAWVPPELREDLGEIEAARRGELPHLVEAADMRGDLHVHTTASDGRATLAEMVAAARVKGYAYMAVTDHSQRMAMVHGLDAGRLHAQVDEIARLNARLSGFTVLAGIEVDILEDGSLDLPDAVLRRLDLVVGAIHSRFNLPQRKQTERLLRAMDNRLLNIVAHPTGRLINERPSHELDVERIMRAAAERGCVLEVNAQPERLDLADTHCRLAKQLGVKVAISTDAHAAAELDFMRFGLDQARRGWLEADDVINTRGLAALRALLRR